MSIIDVKVPQLSESVSEATLLTWHKQVGEAVSEGENLIDVETDKVVLEISATSTGVLGPQLRKQGDTVKRGDVITTIDVHAAPKSKTAVAEAPSKKNVPETRAAAGPGGRSTPALSKSDAVAQASPDASAAATTSRPRSCRRSSMTPCATASASSSRTTNRGSDTNSGSRNDASARSSSSSRGSNRTSSASKSACPGNVHARNSSVESSSAASPGWPLPPTAQAR